MMRTKQHKSLIMFFLAFLIFVSVFPSASASKGDIFTNAIEGFRSMGVNKIRKELGDKSTEYNQGFIYEYVKFNGEKYNEIRFFYDKEDTQKIRAIDFFVAYPKNEDALDDLIWDLNQQYGTPETYTEHLQNKSDVENYRYHTDEGNVARIKIYDKENVEVLYYYSGVEENQPIDIYSIDSSFDFMDMLQVTYKTPHMTKDGSYITMNYGYDTTIWSIFEGFSPVSHAEVSFKNSKLNRITFKYEPFKPSYYDKSLQAVADLEYYYAAQGLLDNLSKTCTYTGSTKLNNCTRYEWQKDNIEYSLEDYSGFIYFSIYVNNES